MTEDLVTRVSSMAIPIKNNNNNDYDNTTSYPNNTRNVSLFEISRQAKHFHDLFPCGTLSVPSRSMHQFHKTQLITRFSHWTKSEAAILLLIPTATKPSYDIPYNWHHISSCYSPTPSAHCSGGSSGAHKSIINSKNESSDNNPGRPHYQPHRRYPNHTNIHVNAVFLGYKA